MAATGTILVQAKVVELGADIDVRKKYNIANTPEAALHAYKTLGAVSVPEMLVLGDVKVSVCDGIWFRSIGGNITLDTNVLSAGVASDHIPKIVAVDSEPIYFKPIGWNPTTSVVLSVAILCSTAAAAYEYVVIGQTS